MEKQAAGVVAARMQAEQLNVRHMRNPSKRMPVSQVRGAECPGNVGDGKARLNVAVVADISIVIVIDEAVRESRPVRKYGNDDEKQRQEPGRSRIVDLRYSCTVGRGRGGSFVS